MRHLRGRTLPAAAIVIAAVAATACDKVPLLAPSGSTIALVTTSSVLPLNGSTELIAQVIEPSGTPPHQGTLVAFTTTLGSIQPGEAETDASGRARVRFFAGSSSGTATITAISGGVASGDRGSLKIAVGAAGVGGVSLNASPTTVSASGGSATLTAKVLDTGGNAFPNVPVTFATDAGSLSASVVNTDSSGVATVVLTTNRTAKVTATAGLPSTTPGTGTGSGTTTPASTATITVTVNAAQALAAGTPSPATPGVGSAVSIPLTYTAVGTTGASPITSVRVNWGDGQEQTFSGQPPAITHSYRSPGSFLVTITGSDAFGDTASAAAAVTVVNGEPSVGVTVDNDNVKSNTAVTFTVTATIPGAPTGVALQNVTIDFGDGSPSQSLGANASSSVKHTYTKFGTFTAVATATATNGQRGSGSVTVTVNP